MALIDRPIIIIGAGRSGTSLLDGVLGAHPEITMFGEFGNSAGQLWQQFWQVSAAETQRTRRIEAIRRREPEPAGTSDDAIFARVRDLERDERARVANIIRAALDQLYTVSELPSRFWGFKEIWAESPDWAAYDLVFPEALYLHIVRHPFDFARSSADWRRVPFTAPQLRTDLAEWLRHLRLNGARAETGRYLRIAYEDLRAEPEAALAACLDRLGLG
ncbi:MAG: sulfotransferase, partial [Aliidongia sp.]